MSLLREIIGYFRVFKKYLGSRLYIVFLLTALAVATEAFGIALLLPLLEMLEAGSAGASSDMPAPSAPSDPSRITVLLGGILELLGIRKSMVGILMFIAVVFVVKGLIRFGEGTYKAVLSASLLREMTAGLFRYYSSMDYSYYTRRNTGHFINVISVQVNRLLQAFETYKKFLSEIIVAVLYLAFAFLISWKFALMAAVAGLLLLYLFRHLNRYVKSLSRKTSEEYSAMHGLLVQTLQAFPYISATAQFGHLGRKVMDSIYRLTGYYRNQRIAQSFTHAIREPVSVLLILVIVILQITIFEARIAPILVSLLLIYRAMGHFIAIQSSWQQTMSMIGGLEMVEKEFDRISRHQESCGSRKLAPLSGQIRFDNVTYTYPERSTPAIRSVSLEIQAQSTVALFGPSGSGKTTIIHLLTLLLEPDRGQVLIDGVPHDRIDRTFWRHQIGLVPQDTVIFDDTIANNISLWKGQKDAEHYGKSGNAAIRRRKADSERGAAGENVSDREGGEGIDSDDEVLRRRIIAAAGRADAMSFIRELPDGLETVVGDRGVRLSGGQKQRLAIARELFKEPTVLILDEATSALDSESERAIHQSMDNLRGSITMIVIAHRVSTIRHADRIFMLDEGRLTGQGSWEELNSMPEFRKIAEGQVY